MILMPLSYMAPGTGGLLLQMIVVGVATVSVTIRSFWSNLKSFWSRKKK